MSKYRVLSLIWIIPAYLIFLVIQQGMVYMGTQTTFAKGEQYEAEIMDLEIKQIAAQSNGFVVLRFETEDGTTIERKKTLSIQMAQQILQSPSVLISYRPNGYPEIVIHPTYAIQVKTSFYNMAVAIVGAIVMVIAAFYIQRYSNRKSKSNDDDFVIERVDL